MMRLEWVKALGSMLLSWPVVGLIALLVFRKALLGLVGRFTDENLQRLKLWGIELERVQKRQDVQESEIKAIQIALKGILTKHEIGLLEGLNGAMPVMIRYEPDLYRYLHRLDGLNFIQPKPGYGLITVEERHKDDERLPVPERPLFDLQEFVYITGDGKTYLEILSRILKKADEQLRGEDNRAS
ncbi:MAG TPA: hypothetical protein VJ302_24080 [Blastocatellia bacterium]|nr:hypothetical protein [Blastocatellia bacterium]